MNGVPALFALLLLGLASAQTAGHAGRKVYHARVWTPEPPLSGRTVYSRVTVTRG